MKLPFVPPVLLALALLGAAPAFAQPESVTGEATAVNADIVAIDGQRIILWGIDAPEPGQTCSVNGREWGCFDAALRELERLVSRADVTCFLVDEPDPFRRRFGVCEMAGEDINAAMVRSGMALAYQKQTDQYVDEQIEAITAEAGLWQIGVEFMEPWVHRSITQDSDAR